MFTISLTFETNLNSKKNSNENNNYRKLLSVASLLLLLCTVNEFFPVKSSKILKIMDIKRKDEYGNANMFL